MKKSWQATIAMGLAGLMVLGVLAGLLRVNFQYSTTAFADTPPPRPDTPAGFTATPVSPSEIGLSWTDVADNTGYRIERSPNGSSSWTTVVSGLGANAASYTNSSLSEGTKYFYRLYAYNSGGDCLTPATANTYTMPLDPNALAVVDVTVDPTPKMQVTWVDRSAHENGFVLERATSSGGSWTSIADLGSSSGTGLTVTYTDASGLSYGTHYWYRVRSYLYMY